MSVQIQLAYTIQVRITQQQWHQNVSHIDIKYKMKRHCYGHEVSVSRLMACPDQCFEIDFLSIQQCPL